MTDDRSISSPIPGYEFLGLVGEGGMGSVYRARQVSLDRVVALKLLTEVHAEDRELLRRFRREIDIHSKLVHPNLVRVIDGGFARGQRYLVLELLEGRTLFEVIQTDAPLDGLYATGLIRQMVAGVSFLHEQGLSHRDLKPANAMVVDDGVLKVLDFGLARGDHHTAMTQADRIIGTLAYIAPEVIEGQPAQAPADVHAMGLMAYELLLGRLPYRGHDLDSWIDHIVGTVPTPIHHFAPRTPSALSDLVSRMLEKHPTRRPTSGEALQVLDEVLEDFGIVDTSSISRPVPRAAGHGSGPETAPRTGVTGGDAPATDVDSAVTGPLEIRVPPRPATWDHPLRPRPPTPGPRSRGARTAGRQRIPAPLLIVVLALGALLALVVFPSGFWSKPLEKVYSWKLEVRNLKIVWTDRYVMEGEALARALAASEERLETGDVQAILNMAYRAENPGQGEPDSQKAVVLLQRAASKDAVDGLVRMGWLHMVGEGVPRDAELARTYLERAGAKGSSAAWVLMAKMFMEGVGVPVDHEKSLENAQAAASLVDPLGLYIQAQHFLHALGVPRDLDRVFALYKQAAALGQDAAIQGVGECYASGWGTETDFPMAFQWYQRAADSGNPVSFMSLGACYMRGEGVEKDEEKAVALYIQAAEAGSHIAQARLGDLYWHGYDRVQPDEERCLYWLNRAAENGLVSARYKLGVFFCDKEEGGVRPDPSRAVHHLELAVEQGSIKGLTLLGARYERGHGVKTDVVKAADYYERAAGTGSALGKLNLARMLERGIGIDPDLERARQLYAEASGSGYRDAQFHYGRFLSTYGKTPADREEARRQLTLALEKGYEPARSFLEALGP